MEVPRQEHVNAVDGVVCDQREHMAQPGFGVHPVQLGSADQRVDGGGTFVAAVCASEQVVAPADDYAKQCRLGRRVVDLDGTVVAMAQQCGPQVQGVLMAADLSDLRESFSDAARSHSSSLASNGRARLPHGPALVGWLGVDLGLNQIQFGVAPLS